MEFEIIIDSKYWKRKGIVLENFFIILLIEKFRSVLKFFWEKVIVR